VVGVGLASCAETSRQRYYRSRAWVFAPTPTPPIPTVAGQLPGPEPEPLGGQQALAAADGMP
jgi:hypothetical protein